MKKEIILIILLLVAAVTFTYVDNAFGIRQKPEPQVVKPKPLYMIREHTEPVQYYFKSRSFRDEYYEVTTSS